VQILIKNQWNDGKDSTNNEFVSAAIDFFLDKLDKESAPCNEPEHFEAVFKFLKIFADVDDKRYDKLKQNLGYDLKIQLS
jgi:hypothetical protein